MLERCACCTSRGDAVNHKPPTMLSIIAIVATVSFVTLVTIQTCTHETEHAGFQHRVSYSCKQQPAGCWLGTTAYICAHPSTL